MIKGRFLVTSKVDPCEVSIKFKIENNSQILSILQISI